MIIEISKWVRSAENILRKYTPNGDPIIIPNKTKTTSFQSILSQIYGIIKILIKTSKINITGTISTGGKINDNPDTLIAANPNPLKPLTVDAINIINANRENSINVNSK